jgi:hypothetical protein
MWKVLINCCRKFDHEYLITVNYMGIEFEKRKLRYGGKQIRIPNFIVIVITFELFVQISLRIVTGKKQTLKCFTMIVRRQLKSFTFLLFQGMTFFASLYRTFPPHFLSRPTCRTLHSTILIEQNLYRSNRTKPVPLE